MPAPREDPDVSLQVRQKLDVDLRLVALDVVPQCRHRVRRRELRPHVAQRIARAGSHDAEVRVHPSGRRLQAPPGALPLHPGDTRFLDLRPGALGPRQQHVVQVEARIDQQRGGQPGSSRPSPAFGADSTLSVTSRLGVEFSIRNGYWLYALCVSAPPQGFSQASFSSIRTTPSPADASFSAANAPAGPPPRIATRFISFCRREEGLPAPASCPRLPAQPSFPREDWPEPPSPAARPPAATARPRAGWHLCGPPPPICCLSAPAGTGSPSAPRRYLWRQTRPSHPPCRRRISHP